MLPQVELSFSRIISSDSAVQQVLFAGHKGKTLIQLLSVFVTQEEKYLLKGYIK